MARTIDEKTVRDTPVPNVGSVLVWDDKIPGFGLRVHARGTKSFLLNYRSGGVQKRVTIGKWPSWTAPMARKRAQELRVGIDRGSDPAGEKRERRAAPTVQDLVDRYIRDRVVANAQSRPADVKRMLAEVAHILGPGTKVVDIHHGNIEAMHKKITLGYEGRKPRPVRANRTLAMAKAAFTLALIPLDGESRPWRNAAEGNPCKFIERNYEEAAGRLYTAEQLAAIADALAAYPGETIRNCVRLIMLTGCRPIEAQRATWSEFDKELGMWIKPSANTKQRKEHPIPLSPPARQLIEQLRARRDPSSLFVFPSTKGPRGHVTAFYYCWTTIREQAGLTKDCRIYDLRHSFATIAAKGGTSLLVIGKLLGHSQSRTTERYARHLASDPLQLATNAVAEQITGGTKLRVVGGTET